MFELFVDVFKMTRCFVLIIYGDHWYYTASFITVPNIELLLFLTTFEYLVVDLHATPKICL